MYFPVKRVASNSVIKTSLSFGTSGAYAAELASVGERWLSIEGNRLIFSDNQEPDEGQTVDRWTIARERIR
jgi:hypothetical protein